MLETEEVIGSYHVVPNRIDTVGSGRGSSDIGHSFPIPLAEKASKAQQLNPLICATYVHSNQP